MNQHSWVENFSLWKFSASYHTPCKIWQLLIVYNIKFFLAIDVMLDTICVCMLEHVVVLTILFMIAFCL